MGSALAYADESMHYGAARDVLKAVNATLKRRDPSDAKARQQNSSGARRTVNLIRNVPKHVLLKELVRREMLELEKANSRERKERFRLRRRRRNEN